ncbi:SAVED domain-containing protein [Methylomonas sp. CM2]|uniref:SAVED domain-containing protein n=1 Tax=Methylomonas sp. CM2 TaxID=3417647 RepID=UPI003CF0CEDE
MPNNVEYIKSFFWKILTWVARPKNAILTVGGLFFTVGLGGGLFFNNFNIKYSAANGDNTEISFGADQTPYYIQYLLWGIGVLGVFILIAEVIYIAIGRSKIKVIGVEHIGLRKRIATSLSSSINNAFTIPIDLTDCYENDKISSPEKALNLTKYGIEETLRLKATEIGNHDATIAYGGTPPVSLGFLAGYLMSNTYHVDVWDYNRNAKNGKNWYKVEGYADANRPIIDRSNYVPDQDVCLLMSISHPISIDQVRAKFVYPSYIDIRLSEIKYDSMSSIEKLKDFEMEFAELLKNLAADGVDRVHIFCAAQSSFNFSMGRQVTRNHPAIIVYEYDIRDPKKYPWGCCLIQKTVPRQQLLIKDL